jgi:uncharacterized protein (DUF2249 family)
VEAVEAHHAQLAGALSLKVESLSAAARARREPEVREARDDLVAWCNAELVPHAVAEEGTLYRAAAERVEGRLLVDAMLAEHQVIIGLVNQLARSTDPVSAAETARALRVLFESHLAKENEQVLPLLAADPQVSLADLLSGMHELLGGAEHAEHAEHEGEPTQPSQEGGCGGHQCACGEVDGPGLPELDARMIPHPIRHATVFGALDSVAPGSGLVLVASHDPLPLLGQLESREPGAFRVEYLERGPETWRLALVRKVA